MFEDKKALLLDMNSTFMFGEDRFGVEEDYSDYYKSIGGVLSDSDVNLVIQRAYEYLEDRYSSKEYRHCFPSLEAAIDSSAHIEITNAERDKIIRTFSFHEHGEIPRQYVHALRALKERFTLALVVDIWAPKTMWIQTFKKLGIWELFSAHSFSSDHGIVKPSQVPFEMVVNKLGIPKGKCLVIGDSVRRDLAGSHQASLDCILVGGANSDLSVGEFPDLLAFQRIVQSCS